MNPQGCDAYNAGSGRSVNPRELAELMLHAAGLEKPVVSRREVRSDEVLEMVADVGKAKRTFGWQPRVPLAEGLARMIETAPKAKWPISMDRPL